MPTWRIKRGRLNYLAPQFDAILSARVLVGDPLFFESCVADGGHQRAVMTARA